MITIQALYRHYKGGLYFVQFTAETHNHNGDIDVVYFSLTHGKHCTRPLRKDSRKEDSWLDGVEWPDGIVRQRFIAESNFQSLSEVVKANLEALWKKAEAEQRG